MGCTDLHRFHTRNKTHSQQLFRRVSMKKQYQKYVVVSKGWSCKRKHGFTEKNSTSGEDLVNNKLNKEQ